MKRRPMTRLRFLNTLVTILFALVSATAASAGEMKIEAQLIWGTNEDKSPDPNHKPIDPKLAKRLDRLPIKWKHYYVVTVKEFSVAQGKTNKVTMSKECEIAVKNVDGTNVEVQLIGKGKPAGKVSQGLGKGKCLLTGGDAENLTAWFVLLKLVE